MRKNMIKVLFVGLAVVMVIVLMQVLATEKPKLEEAVFAGGCFWCMEHPFEKMDGVKEVISGYTGGHKDNPTYKDVSAGITGHAEAVKIIYDPTKITYEKLLKVFWMQIDPTDGGGQFVDRGSQYRAEIFYLTETQRVLAEKSKEELNKSGRFDAPIVTAITPASTFYDAEEYHQDYYKKNPRRYEYYRSGSGRDQYLEKAWENPVEREKLKSDAEKYVKPSPEKLKKELTPIQYKVTQLGGTEPPFRNEYWDNKKKGIYIDIVSGEPLFSSTHKFKSGTGWPSFIRPLAPENIVEKKDGRLFSVRIEVRSLRGDSHLGHVFQDGPTPTGLRYCINSASLRFIPKEDIEKAGYGEYLKLFE